MQESLVLFESVINSRWFLRTSVILFLNKIDVFKQKLPKVPLVHYFPEYTGGADINKAAKYILWRFTQTNRARLSVYPHLTQATDTSNVSGIPTCPENVVDVRSDWCLLLSRKRFCKTHYGTLVFCRRTTLAVCSCYLTTFSDLRLLDLTRSSTNLEFKLLV